jgi:lycopene cyclase domain-containing protein
MLPDITVFGPYTYLVTELLWASVAIGLVLYADVLRVAARTVAVLYPPALLWDWYTLEVGVFAIPMRTGVELVGVPLEEHIFMVVVPAMVVGTHETLRIHLDAPDVDADTDAEADTDVDADAEAEVDADAEAEKNI